MDKDRQRIECEAKVTKAGTLELPPSVLKHFVLKEGSTVHVGITTRRLSHALKDRTVTEEEVERIGGLQLEPRESVVSFLTAEGSLASARSFRKRAKDVLK